MRRWIVGLVMIVVALILFWFWRLSGSSDVTEIRARLLRGGSMNGIVTDLDRDGNDEVVIEVHSHAVFPWQRYEETVKAITIRKGQFETFPVPYKDVRAVKPKGQRLIGKNVRGDIVVAERLSDGKWQEQLLLPKGTGFLFNYYNLGDLDGNGQDDDAIVLAGSKGERVLWFRRFPDGRWRKAGELSLPTGKGQEYHLYQVTEYGAELLVSVRPTMSLPLPLLFHNGRWQVGQPDEAAYLFVGDWDGDKQRDKLLVHFVRKASKVRLLAHSSGKGHISLPDERALTFGSWQVLAAGATDKLGDGRWHLLLAMAKAFPITMRVMDCYFEPSKGWQISEVNRWQIVKVMPWRTLQLPEHVYLKIGDTDGDGRDEVVVSSDQGRWLLRQARQKWTVQPLQFKRGQTLLNHYPIAQIGNRLWFSRTFFEWVKTPSGFSGEHLTIAELGTFRPDGKWRPVGQYHRASLNLGEELEDLNGDGIPELLTFKGLLVLRPVLYYRSSDGRWQEKGLHGVSLWRMLGGIGQADLMPTPERIFVVQCDNKKWFVIFWDDGIVQAVTMR